MFHSCYINDSLLDIRCFVMSQIRHKVAISSSSNPHNKTDMFEIQITKKEKSQ